MASSVSGSHRDRGRKLRLFPRGGVRQRFGRPIAAFRVADVDAHILGVAAAPGTFHDGADARAVLVVVQVGDVIARAVLSEREAYEHAQCVLALVPERETSCDTTDRSR